MFSTQIYHSFTDVIFKILGKTTSCCLEWENNFTRYQTFNVDEISESICRLSLLFIKSYKIITCSQSKRKIIKHNISNIFNILLFQRIAQCNSSCQKLIDLSDRNCFLKAFLLPSFNYNITVKYHDCISDCNIISN